MAKTIPPGPAEPRQDASRRQLKQAFTRLTILLAVIFSVRYFYWRAHDTQNPLAMWFFYVFLAAELLNFLEAALFYVTTWKPSRQGARAPLPNRTVDVLIATYNEPVSLLRETVICAVAMKYPHKTYILDDGNRAEVRELARQFGCGYFARTERRHAKAGNLNNALKLTDGEFIVTLDADHVPMPDLIDQTIGFFGDPAAAAVQTSQDFYNLDSFQHLTEWRRQYAWQQQELFFSVIQPGKDGYNAAFYCGSPAMLRRKALEDVGGFATETITEDMHTGLRLQRKGWRVIYYNRTLARGLAPQTYTGFVTQWHRWGHGAMQVLRQEKPIFGKGLTFGQRVCYFASFYFYWMSYQKLLYVLTPIFCLLTGIFPLVADPAAFVRYFLPYFLLNLLATAPLQGGLRGFLLSEQFNLAKMPVLMKSVAGLFRRESHFAVTPKSRAPGARWADVGFHLVLLAGLVVGIVVGGWRLYRAAPGFQYWVLVVTLLWAIFYLLLTTPVVWRAVVREELRSSYRFPRQLHLPVTFAYVSTTGERKNGQTYARNLNRSGFSVTCDYAIPQGTLLEVELKLSRRSIRARGRVIHSRNLRVRGKRRVVNGVQFEQIDPIDQDEISKFLFWEIAPRHGNLLRLTKTTQSKEPGHGSS